MIVPFIKFELKRETLKHRPEELCLMREAGS